MFLGFRSTWDTLAPIPYTLVAIISSPPHPQHQLSIVHLTRSTTTLYNYISKRMLNDNIL